MNNEPRGKEMINATNYFTFTVRAMSSLALDNDLVATIYCAPKQIVDGLLKPSLQTGLPNPDQIEAAVLAATRVLEMAVMNPGNEALQNAAHELRRVSGIAVSGQVTA